MSDTTHEFEELNLEQMEEVGGGIWPAAFFAWLAAVQAAQNATKTTNAVLSDAELEDRWDATFGMG